jgi:hypothetical protein
MSDAYLCLFPKGLWVLLKGSVRPRLSHISPAPTERSSSPPRSSGASLGLRESFPALHYTLICNVSNLPSPAPLTFPGNERGFALLISARLLDRRRGAARHFLVYPEEVAKVVGPPLACARHLLRRRLHPPGHSSQLPRMGRHWHSVQQVHPQQVAGLVDAVQL